MTPPAAIIDIDGTLVDSNYEHALAWYRAFRLQRHHRPRLALPSGEPDLIEAALELVDGGPGVMIGDSTWDVEAAKKLKVKTLCVRTGGFGADELLESGAEAVFESLVDMRRRLDETPFG